MRAAASTRSLFDRGFVVVVAFPLSSVPPGGNIRMPRHHGENLYSIFNRVVCCLLLLLWRMMMNLDNNFGSSSNTASL